MRMSTTIVNGTEAEDNGQKFLLAGGTVYESTKMKSLASPSADFEKSTPKVGEQSCVNPEQVSSMKDLILIHLDYIQLQSEQLGEKDKQLEELKAQNEMLKQRLARMERRVSLQKTRGEKKHQSSTKAPQEAQTSTDPAPRKRRITIENQSSSTPPTTSRKSLGTDVPLTSKRIRSSEKAPSVVQLRIKTEPDENANENEPPVLLDGHLTSRIAYHTLMGDKPNCLLKYVKRTKKQKPTPFQVELPLWRIKNLTSTYTMEGTEPLSDDVFERRHYKLMVDEKKRKRWDVQRIKQQRQLEKLRSREGSDKNHDRQYQSLWPQSSEGLRLSVTSLVPVSVFGINLPAVKTQDFTLPWKEGTRHVSSRRRTKR